MMLIKDSMYIIPIDRVRSVGYDVDAKRIARPAGDLWTDASLPNRNVLRIE